MPTQPASFDDIIQMLAHLPSPENPLNSDDLVPIDQLGEWLACWQYRDKPQISHPRLSLFAATHGFAADEPNATTALVHDLTNGSATAAKICTLANADLRVYEMDLATPTHDWTVKQSPEPAMTETQCVHAIVYGMMAVEPGIDLLCLGTISSNQQPSYFMVNQPLSEQPVLSRLQTFGGFEMAACLGAILAARMAKIPVILSEDLGTMAAARVAYGLHANAITHTCFSVVDSDLYENPHDRLAASMLHARMAAL